MKKLAMAVAVCVALSSLSVPAAEARHRSSSYHRHHDTVGDIIGGLLVAGLVIAAVGADSYDYVGSPWGVIDTEVTPKDAEVYIDGGLAGQAKSFDGWPGYLPLHPGKYRIEFREQGFAPYRVEVRVLPGRRLVIKKRLRPLGAGEAAPLPPQRQGPPPTGRERDERDGRDERQDREDWRWDEPESRNDRQQAPPEAQGPPPVVGQDTAPTAPSTPPTATDATDMSELKLEITPEDASVYLDGQFYLNAKDLEGGARAILLAPGEYKVEVVRPGYKTQTFTVVLGAKPRTLKVNMEKQ